MIIFIVQPLKEQEIKHKYVVIKDCPNPINAKKIIAIKGDIILQCNSKEINYHIKNGIEIYGKIPRECIMLYEDWLTIRKSSINQPVVVEEKEQKSKSSVSYHKKPNEKSPIIKNKEAKIRLEGTKDWLKNPPLIHTSNIFILPSKDTLIKQVMAKEEDGWRVFWIHENAINIFRSNIPMASIEDKNEPIELSSEAEVTEMFSELEDILDKNEKYKPANEQSFQILFGWQPGMIDNEVSPAWTLFRCRAATPERLQKFVHACQMIISGLHSGRAIQRETGWSIHTVQLLIKKILAFKEKMGLGDILCPCGQPIIAHKGWCSYRFSKSEARQETIKNLTASAPKENQEEKVKKECFENLNYEHLESETIEYVHPSEKNIDAIEIIPSKKWPKRVAKLDENRAKQIRIYILMNPNLSEQKIANIFLVSPNTIRLLKQGNIYRDAIPTKEDILALQSPKNNSPDWLISDELYDEVCFGDFDTSGDGYTDYFLEAGLINNREALWQIKYHRHPWGTEESDCPFCRYVNESGSEIYETDTYTCRECKKEFNTLTGTHVDGIEISYAQLWKFAWFVSKRIDHFKIIAQQLRIPEETSKKLLLILEKEGKVDTWEYWKKENEVLEILLGPINKVNGIFNVKVEAEPGKWPK